MSEPEQYSLFGGLPPHSNTTTSRAAAVSMVRDASRLGRLVLQFIAECDGLTCDEIERAAGLSHQTASARVRELVLKGLVTDSGHKRNTCTGRKAIVWVEVGR